MTQSLLKMPQKQYLAKLRLAKAICIAVAILCFALNLVFVLLSQNGDVSWLVVCNIVVTIACCWFLVAYVTIVLQPMQRLYQLATLPTEQIQVQIVDIDTKSQRVSHFDCIKVISDQRIFFLIEGTFRLAVGQQVTLCVASNVITGVTND